MDGSSKREFCFQHEKHGMVHRPQEVPLQRLHQVRVVWCMASTRESSAVSTRRTGWFTSTNPRAGPAVMLTVLPAVLNKADQRRGVLASPAIPLAAKRRGARPLLRPAGGLPQASAGEVTSESVRIRRTCLWLQTPCDQHHTGATPSRDIVRCRC